MTEYKTEKYNQLFERLERATNALEAIVKKNISSTSTSTSDPNPPKLQISDRALSDLDISTTEINPASPSVKGFDDFLELYVDPFVSLSKETDELVGEQAERFSKALQFQRKFIKAASVSKSPDFSNPSSVEFLTPLQEIIQEINTFKDDNRKSQYFSHLNAIAEGTGALGWILNPTPVSFIPDIKESVTFWTNKVLKEFREKDQKHVEWVKQYLAIFDGLKLYVKQHHTTGLTWKSDGGDFKKNLSLEDRSSTDSSSVPSVVPTPVPTSTPATSTTAPTAPTTGGAPPPPPPPPPPASIFEVDTPTSSGESVSSSKGINAVFSELNQGENITKGLKKVEKSQMTHKNPELRESSVVRVPSNGKKSPPVPKKPNSLSRKPKPEPVVELQDSKWIVKNVEGNHNIIIDGEISQSIFIADSKDSTIQVKGKVNAVSISSTTKVALVIDAAISGISVINSKKFGIQIVEKVPQISIDKSDEGQIYLSQSSLSTEIYTTSTSSLNVNVPDTEDFKEIAIPEQFKFTFNEKGELSSEVVEHAG